MNSHLALGPVGGIGMNSHPVPWSSRWDYAAATYILNLTSVDVNLYHKIGQHLMVATIK